MGHIYSTWLPLKEKSNGPLVLLFKSWQNYAEYNPCLVK